MAISAVLKEFRKWVAPDPPDPTPLTVSAARALAERDRFSRLLTYREVDEHYFVTLDDGDRFAAAFSSAGDGLTGKGCRAISSIARS